MQNKNKLRTFVAVLCCLVSTGCAVDPKTGQPSFKGAFASDDPCSNNARNIGIAVGALAGAVIGNQVSHSNTARLLGAAAGAGVGGLIGFDLDRRRCALYKIAKANNLEMQVDDLVTMPASPANGSASASPGRKPQVVGMKVAIKDNGMQFLSGSDALRPEAQAYFGIIADQYSYVQQKKTLNGLSGKEEIAAVEQLKTKQIFLIGHTDDTGDSKMNADLSERRARAVARVFKEHGIAEDQIFFQGAGETLPMADNRTDDGRAKNRRVEIVDTPNQASFAQYLEGRKPNLAFYRPSTDQVLASTPEASRPKGKQQLPAKQTVLDKSAAKPADAAPAKNVAGSTVMTTKPATPQAKSNANLQSVQQMLPNEPVASAATSQANIPAAARADSINFGGALANGNLIVPDIGKMQQTSTVFNIISSAHAGESPPLTSCGEDRPRVANGVKSLGSGREQKFSTSDYLPGVYDSSWSGMVNGHLIALTHVAVLKDGGAPARTPDLLVYQNFTGGKNAMPTYSGTAGVNTYRGTNALLYRVFTTGPTRCMDIVIPNSNPKIAPNSNLVYQRGGELYQVAFTPSLVR
jgi:outer membrane protein OmpA-like peptidoglycan-associated protein